MSQGSLIKSFRNENDYQNELLIMRRHLFSRDISYDYQSLKKSDYASSKLNSREYDSTTFETKTYITSDLRKKDK